MLIAGINKKEGIMAHSRDNDILLSGAKTSTTDPKIPHPQTPKAGSPKRFNAPPLKGLMDDPGVDISGDARMLAAYLQSGKALSPLPMSIGDPYLLGSTLPAGLAEYERKAPPYLGGYSRTPAGIPLARRLIRDVTVRGQQLDGLAVAGKDFDLHVTSATGTRGLMRDFGRYLLDNHPKDDTRTPVILCATPTWDYAGALASLGYEMGFWPLRPENGWLPDVTDAEAALAAIDVDPSKRLAMVIVNTQHNPTGRSWPKDVLVDLFRAATSRGAGILLDDPYYFVVTNDVQPVSAPAVLFEYLADNSVPAGAELLWCRVQSFGKAFVCNNWGIGSVMAHPETLRELAQYTLQWAFYREGLRQWAMAQWLNDPACQQYLAEQRAILGRKRSLWVDTLRDLGWPLELTALGETTPYYLMAVPPSYLSQSDGITKWRQDIFDSTGILLSYASIEQEGTGADVPYLRAYLGGPEETVIEAAQRLRDAGVKYQ
jgi:aspartate/methionine/tyrosine aminotransferase